MPMSAHRIVRSTVTNAPANHFSSVTGCVARGRWILGVTVGPSGRAVNRAARALRPLMLVTAVAFAALARTAAAEPAIDNARPMPVRPGWFGIRVVDEAGAGVPLVELRTVNEIRLISDNAGWIAWQEPGLMDREVFWTVAGPGIEHPADGFGFRGFRAVTRPGESVICRVTTKSIARRVGRITGAGKLRDSELLGLVNPPNESSDERVVGQDSVQMVPVGDSLLWLWGDTNQARYPLGNFHTTCAWTSRDEHPETGLAFRYLIDAERPGSLRKMFPTSESGLVWMFGLMKVAADNGQERVFAGFSRRQGLETPLEQGVAELDRKVGHFRKVADVPAADDWGLPYGHAVPARTNDGDHIYFCRPFAHTRVAATVDAVTDPKQYEHRIWDAVSKAYRWQRGGSPTTQADERKRIAAGELPAAAGQYQVIDVASGDAIELHTGSIVWNEYRQRYVLIAVEQALTRRSPSLLGEVWYAESRDITGPWTAAIKVASHPQYSFYNPIQHPLFSRDGGRVIYFEGTYTATFSGNPSPTPRYDYNQLMYRLDLADPSLEPARDRELRSGLP